MTNAELIAKYPKIFDKTSYNCGWHIPETWIPVVDEMCAKLQAYCDANNSQIICEQMKEKFGMFRFYTNGVDEYIGGLIKEARNQLSKMCEYCGCSDCQLYVTQNWISITCKSCAERLNKIITE